MDGQLDGWMDTRGTVLTSYLRTVGSGEGDWGERTGRGDVGRWVGASARGMPLVGYEYISYNVLIAVLCYNILYSQLFTGIAILHPVSSGTGYLVPVRVRIPVPVVTGYLVVPSDVDTQTWTPTSHEGTAMDDAEAAAIAGANDVSMAQEAAANVAEAVEASGTTEAVTCEVKPAIAASPSQEMLAEGAGSDDDAEDATDAEALLCQIRVDGVNRYASRKQLLHRLEVTCGVKGIRKIKKLSNQDFAFVYFGTSAQRYAAEALISEHKWKGSTFSVRQARAMDPERHLKRHREDGGSEGGARGKKARQDGRAGGSAQGSGARGSAGLDADGKVRAAEDVVTPLHALPYPEQLVHKRQGLLDELRRLPHEMKHASMGVAEYQRGPWKRLPWLQAASIEAHEGAPCPLSAVTPAPVIHGYRNKCEFSFGRDADGAPCLGFQLGQIRLIGAVVGSPAKCPNVSAEMKAVVARIQSFLLASPLPPYDKMTGEGYWRQLTARQAFNPPPASDDGDGGGSAKGGASALLLVILVQSSAAAADVAAAEQERLLRHLDEPPLEPACRLSVAIQQANAPGEPSTGVGETWLRGPPYVEERLLGLSYRVSSSAFFQVCSIAICSRTPPHPPSPPHPLIPSSPIPQTDALARAEALPLPCPRPRPHTAPTARAHRPHPHPGPTA